MIKIRNLSVSFSENRVLENISFDFSLNMVYGIVGLNGSGKTTFFNAVSRILKPNSGNVLYNDKEIKASDSSYLETVNFFYSRITGNEYLKIFRQTNSNFNLSLLQEYFKLPLDELIENYSSGMKKKLALLAVLKQDRGILLLDEPFNGLDLESNKILELIITVLRNKSKTILISSHIIDPLLTVCDEIIFLENGKFTKSFHKEQFSSIEEELFGKLKTEAKEKILRAI